MKMHLSNLPAGTDESDVRSLVEQYGEVDSIELLGESDSDNLESLVALREQDRAVVDKLAEKINGLNWKGTKIRAKVLLFQGDDDPADS
ncbi:MAG TPA: RNA-binding protein [Gammaproteobacteria bacterium]|nr:RNA-binding protein [Gammaproteobacteria bacterium]